MKRIIIPILILIVGLASMVGLMQSGGSEERLEPAPVLLQVEVVEARQQAQQAQIYSSGVVSAMKQISIIPQVSGKIVRIAEGLQAGRRFEKGELIAEIEATDYKFAVRQERARVAQASLNLQLEEERMSAAQQEWELLGNEGQAPELASRRPHLELMKTNLDAAKASLDRAQLNVSRTKIFAPFNAVVQQEQLDIGQIVGGASVMVLQGTDSFMVRATVPVSRLMDIAIPDIDEEEASEVTIRFTPSNRVALERKGRVLRLEGALDPQARTANILIEVKEPLQGELPLLLGSYVSIQIHGKSIDKGYRLPATTLREGSYVLVADAENKLARKDVEVGWIDQEEMVIIDGLDEGDKIVETSISYPIYGSQLQIKE